MPLDAINYTGKNFAPIKPLQEAKTIGKRNEKNPSSVNAFFRELWQGLWNENEASRREVIEQARVISNLRSGKLTIKGDLSGTGYVFFKRTQQKDRSNYPVFPQNSEILTSKWQKAKIGVRARHFGDGYKTDIALNQIDTMVKSYFRDIFTSDYETREAYSAQDYGTYITQFEYDDQLNQMLQIVPIMQNQSKVLVDGYGGCYDCEFEGHPSDFEKTGAAYPQCPECESFRTTNMVPDAVADESVVSDIETVSQGDIRGSLRDWGACQYDPRVFAHESDYFLYSDRIPIRMLGKMFGEDLEIERGDADDIGFQVMDALSVRGGNTENLGESSVYGTFERFTEEGIRRNMWLKPSMYAGFKLEKAENTLAGRIPAGVPFEEIFPEGLCIRGFNDMRIQTHLHAEKANIASAVYLYQSHSGHGKSIADAVDSAKDLNEVYSMAMAGLKRYGAGGMVIDSNAGLTQEDVRNLFKPEKAVFADLSNTAQGNINNAVMQVQPNPVNPVLPQMMIQLVNMMNLAFMTGDFSQGMIQNVDIDTFGGQQLANAKAEEQKGGIFARKTSHRTQAAEIITELFRKHIKIPRFYAHGMDRHGTTRGKWIVGVDMPERIKFDAVPDSEIPENKFEKRIARQEMIDKAGGLAMFAQAVQVDPKLTAWYAEGFGQELPMLDEEEIQLVCLSRLANIKELSEIFPDPEQILASLEKPLNVREASHMLKSEFLQQILDDDEVATWNPLAKATVETLIERHYELEAEAQVRNELIKMKAMNALAMEQQAASQQIMQPQMDAQKAEMEEQAMMGMAQEVGGRVLDDEQKQVDADREEEAKDADEARSERSADKQHDRQMELEKAKAKLKPAPKGAARNK